MSCYEFPTLLASVIAAVASVLGGFVAWRAYKMSLYSQKLQNAQVLVNSFYDSLRENDIEEFRDIIMLRGESAGGDNQGHYMGEDGQLQDFSLYFAEGAPDHGALNRIIDNLDRVCFFAKEEKIDMEFFYSELWHFLNLSHEILVALKAPSEIKIDSNIMRCFKDMEDKYPYVPKKIIGYIEE